MPLPVDPAWKINPAAFRHGDALLPQHGIPVLRFLTGNLGKRLAATLDGILQAVAHCRRKSR